MYRALLRAGPATHSPLRALQFGSRGVHALTVLERNGFDIGQALKPSGK
jgi:hypothetical protein